MFVLRLIPLVLLVFLQGCFNFPDQAGPSFPIEVFFGVSSSVSEPLELEKSRPILAKTKLPPLREKGLASGYAAWKPEWIQLGKRRLKVSNGKPYCWYFKKVHRGDPIIAHRRLPCGTRVYVGVVGTQRGGWVQVGDRGPYGACAKRSDIKKLQRRLGKKLTTWNSSWCHKRYGKDWVWYIKRRASWPGIYRGIADISHTARRLIGHNGWQQVTLRYWHPKAQPRSVAQAQEIDPGLALVDAYGPTRHSWSER